MRALSTASSSVAAPGRTTAPSRVERGHELEVDLLVVEGHDVAAVGEGPEVRRHERRAQHHLGGHATGGVVGMLGQDGHGEAERAGRLTGHAGQLTSPDEPDRVACSGRSPPSGDSPRQWGGHNRQTTRGAPGTWPSRCASGA